VKEILLKMNHKENGMSEDKKIVQVKMKMGQVKTKMGQIKM